ncbi:unnamed protein product, partial [Cyprideis torosa]
PSLAHLDLTKNSGGHKIHSFFDLGVNRFSGMKNLTHLMLSLNEILFIGRETFSGLDELEHLELDQSQISEIEPGAFSSLSNLKTLNLSSNKLGFTSPFFVQDFANLSRLEILDLSHNALSNMPVTDFTFQSVESLLLTGNRFRELDRLWIGPNLKYLDVSKNQISVYRPWSNSNESFSLELLDFSSNHLLYLDKDLLEVFNQTHSLLLGDNPFICSCDMLPYVRWLQKHAANALVLDVPLCSYPKYVARGLDLE